MQVDVKKVIKIQLFKQSIYQNLNIIYYIKVDYTKLGNRI